MVSVSLSCFVWVKVDPIVIMHLLGSHAAYWIRSRAMPSLVPRLTRTLPYLQCQSGSKTRHCSLTVWHIVLCNIAWPLGRGWSIKVSANWMNPRRVYVRNTSTHLRMVSCAHVQSLGWPYALIVHNVWYSYTLSATMHICDHNSRTITRHWS